jgi:hypothetical protein
MWSAIAAASWKIPTVPGYASREFISVAKPGFHAIAIKRARETGLEMLVMVVESPASYTEKYLARG